MPRIGILCGSFRVFDEAHGRSAQLAANRRLARQLPRAGREQRPVAHKRL